MSSLQGVARGTPPYAYSKLVCDCGITDHPHYLDCGNCPHNIWCEKGILRVGTLELARMYDEINANVDAANAETPGLNLERLSPELGQAILDLACY